jgi:hypothetical protein
MPNLNSMQPQVREIIKYLWSREASDYARLLAGGEEVESHIFVSLMQVSNVLNGTNTNVKLWAFEQFNNLFEKMRADDLCPGCDDGTLELVPAEARNPEHLICSDCESIYAVVREEGERIHCPNPDHDDKNPSAIRSRDGSVHCFSCGWKQEGA